MKFWNFAKIGFGTAVASLILVGCGKDKAKQLEGNWKNTTCEESDRGEFTKTYLSLQGKVISVKTGYYTDASCSKGSETKTVRVKGSYSADAEKVTSEFRRARVFYTFHKLNADELRGINAINFGGISTWKANEERDVTNNLTGVPVSRDNLQRDYGAVKFEVDDKKLKLIPEKTEGETYEFDRE